MIGGPVRIKLITIIRK